eukprot:169097_1
MADTHNNKTLSAPENFVLSGIAAALSKTVAAPLERVKLLLQNQSEMIKSERLTHPYKSALDCLRRTVANEGVLSLWRGNWINCMRYWPSQSFNFMFKELLQSRFKPLINQSQSWTNKMFYNTISGSVAGLLSQTFLYSMYYCRVRLANDAYFLNDLSISSRQYKGIIDVYRQTYRSDGIIGLYRGYVISCWTVMIYRGIYFGMYDTFKPLVIDTDSTSSESKRILSSFVLAFAITMNAGIIIYPLDTIATRMLMRSGTNVKYSGSVDCFKHIWRTEGITALYRGCLVNIFRNISGAGTLVGFDVMKRKYMTYSNRN